MSNWSSKKITTVAALVAINVALSYIIRIPVPATSGYVNLLEGVIFLAALFMGQKAGFLVGAFSGGLLDLLAGYPHWILFSFLIHGLEGWVAGMAKEKASFQTVLLLLLSSVIMVLGYFLAASFLYNWQAALSSVPGNIAQTLFGLIVALLLKKAMPDKLF
ncbi:ECF transporter S component [Fructobacillus sp. M1-13]|uniref:ECF transporter S component n=1 Tax=Fructobacillus papyriferae TaxID=2713171 RepID=A0ABS5QQ69_9LACO|nr:ECF transporter S component [Fructobacillus papyriferae]MBS9335250.1 ECF transporter S component [Fructobacillus papyriferae]MCD2159081.1 ECF transporter S component [Fructobacillus papyriferae]